MKIAFAGFDLMYPALEALSRDNEIVRLFTCRVDGKYETNNRVRELAASLGVPYTYEPITRADIDELFETGCGLLVSAGYYYLIPVDSRLPMVNIHPSLLPYGRGAWPMPLAILDKLPESGVTVHKLAESFDTGDILMQRRFALTPDEDLESFMDKVNSLLPDMMSELTADFPRLYAGAQPQGEGEYQAQPDPADYVLSAEYTVEFADRVLRAFRGFPCYYDDGEREHNIYRKNAYYGENTGEPYPLKDGYIR